MDSSGVDAIHKVTTYFAEQGQEVRLRNLDANCHTLLYKAGSDCRYQLEN